MNKEQKFQDNWKQLVSHSNIEEIDKKDIARMFFDFGYSNGLLK